MSELVLKSQDATFLLPWALAAAEAATNALQSKVAGSQRSFAALNASVYR